MTHRLATWFSIMRLNRFNDLPPRPEHVAKVRRALSRQGQASAMQLIERTGLTRTAVLSALEALIAAGEAAKLPAVLTFVYRQPPR